MKRTIMALVPAFLMSLGSIALAADAAAKPDCAEKQKVVDDATAAAKAVPKADLSSCKDKKGKEKADCAKPLKEKASADAKAAKDKVKEAKTALSCCKNPKKKGCST